MTLSDKGLSKELAEITESNYGDFQLARLREAVNKLGFVVVRLRGVDSPDTEAAGEVDSLKKWW